MSVVTTLRELRISTISWRKNIPSLPRTAVSGITYTLNIDMDTLLTRAYGSNGATLLTEGSVQGSLGKIYTVNIQFLNVELNPLTAGDAIEVQTSQRIGNRSILSTVLVRRVREVSTPVKVHCQCDDYVHTFSIANDMKGCNYDGKSNYRRKTQTRPPRNPQHIIGL